MWVTGESNQLNLNTMKYKCKEKYLNVIDKFRYNKISLPSLSIGMLNVQVHNINRILNICRLFFH